MQHSLGSSLAQEFAQGGRIGRFIFGWISPRSLHQVRLPTQMIMRRVTRQIQSLKNAWGALDPGALLSLGTKHARVEDIVLQGKEPVHKGLRTSPFDKQGEQRPEPTSGRVFNGHYGSADENKKKQLDTGFINCIGCLHLCHLT